MPYSEEHLKKASELINASNIYALSTYVPLLDRCPEMKSVADSNLLPFWDYLMTIGCVGTAFMEIADLVPDKEQPGIGYALQIKLGDWEPNSYEVMIDFVTYVNKLVDKGIEIPDAIGGWVWVNLERHPQSNEELKELASSLKLVRVAGLQILLTFHNWWKK